MLHSLILRSDSMIAPSSSYSFKSVGPELFVYCLANRGSTEVFLLLRISVILFGARQLIVSVSPRF